jgi:signal peptidase
VPDRGGGSGRALRALDVIATAVLVLVIVFLATVLIGEAFGLREYSVQSGSMSPAIKVGDVVVSRSIAPLDAEPGQVVTFHDPALGGLLVSHRVVSRALDPTSRSVVFVTKGDANQIPERWSVPVSGSIGRSVLVVPFLGTIMAPFVSTAGRVALLCLLAVWALFVFLRWIWREEPDVDPATAVPAAGSLPPAVWHHESSPTDESVEKGAAR